MLGGRIAFILVLTLPMELRAKSSELRSGCV